MHFVLTAEELDFEEGEVSLRPNFSLLSAPDQRTARLHLNVTDDLADIIAGDVHLLLTQCLVRRKGDSVSFRVPVFALMTRVSEAQIEAGAAEIPIGPHAMVAIEAVDAHQRPLIREHVLGVALEGMSIETKGPENSPLYVLLPPGGYTAYLSGPGPIYEPFIVGEHGEHGGVIRLQDTATEPRPSQAKMNGSQS